MFPIRILETLFIHRNVIKILCEGDVLELKANNHNNAWRIFTPNNDEIGCLSKRGTQLLKHKGIFPGQFQFQPGEVTVRYLYHHTKRDDITGKTSENWFVVIPQIRVCRNAKNYDDRCYHPSNTIPMKGRIGYL